MQVGSIGAGVLLSLSMVASGTFALGAEDADATTFPMTEISILDGKLDRELLSAVTRGARAECQQEPHEAVKAYPELASEKPIYGVILLAPKSGLIRFDSDRDDPDLGVPIHFVVDESGQATAESKKEPETLSNEAEEEPSFLDRLGSALGMGEGKPNKTPEPPKLDNTYDRLYVDLNGDLDLTNDRVVVPMKKVPQCLDQRYSSLLQLVVFEEIAVPLDFGEELGKRPVRIVPQLTVQEYEGEEYSAVQFIAATARQGTIALGRRKYQALLAQRFVIMGRYDQPYTGLLLTSPEIRVRHWSWWGAHQLNAMRRVDGKHYTTTTTPLGDKLIVKPYDGPTGVLKIGAGGRNLSEKLSVQGSLHMGDTNSFAAIAIGEPNEQDGMLEPVGECRLPVGDYIPSYVTIEFGDLQLGISENYHCDGKPMAVDRSAWKYGIEIREDKPFVWDFSTPPEVLFASPAKDQAFSPGDEVSVKGVLIDPELTIMIRRLTDTSRMEEKTIELADGGTSTYKTQVSLDPIVTITNAAGKQIAEGPMPFG